MGIIYKATNIKNNKFYIGQTSGSLKNRIYKHFSDKKIYPERKFYQELNNEDFIWEILEDNIENDMLLDVENAYIISTNAYDLGYNMKNCTEFSSKLTDEDINEIIKLLKYSNFTIRKIADMFNVSESHVGSINKGKKHRIPSLKYPIRNTNKERDLFDYEVSTIIYMLKYTNLKQIDIANYFNISRKRVTSINNGNTYYKETEVYPIRKQKIFSNETVSNVINALKNTKLTYCEISKIYGCSKDTVARINHGKYSYFNNDLNLKFPIRDTEKKVKKDIIYDELFKLLSTTQMSYANISNLLKVSKSMIVNFNNGRHFKSLEYSKNFPIRNKCPL